MRIAKNRENGEKLSMRQAGKKRGEGGGGWGMTREVKIGKVRKGVGGVRCGVSGN